MLKPILFLFLLCLTLNLAISSSEEESDESNKSTTPENKNVKVAIVGGGIAGLAAFNKLQSAGLENVDLFEASDRLGGRVFPVPFEDGFLQLGAEYVESQGNPLFDIAKRLNLLNESWDMNISDIFDSVVFKSGKCPADEDQVEEFKNWAQKLEDNLYDEAEERKNWNKSIGGIYHDALEKYIKSKDREPTEIKLINALSDYYKKYYENEWGAPIDKISLRNFNAWGTLTPNTSTNTLNKIGYKAILDELTRNLPRKSVHLSSKVTLIDYSGEKTRLKINDNKFYETQYDYVISTVPLGYLKAHVNDLFEPKLTKEKLKVIEALGVGSLTKVFIVYEEKFWKEDGVDTTFVPLQIEGCIEKSEVAPALFILDVVRWKPNVLLAWSAGDVSTTIDNLSDEELSEKITEHFKNTMTDVKVVKPVKIIRKSWIKDENFLGSYSYITPKAANYANPAKILAKPVFNKQKPKVLFAGEQTHSKLYQSTVGAYLTGEREANRVVKFSKKYNKN